jgi:hypothetical protein
MRAAGERAFTAPYQPHSATSKEASAKIAPKLGDLHRKVWAHLNASGGCTDEQGIAGTGLAASTYRPRRIELVAAGFVEDSGHTARTKADRPATVWRVTKTPRGAA